MEFNPQDLEQSAIYKLLTGSIIPRPIGWISTIDENGINNLAPFSYFNIVGENHYDYIIIIYPILWGFLILMLVVKSIKIILKKRRNGNETE